MWINKSVQLPTYAGNVTLPVAAATIDQYLLPTGPTAANLPHAAASDEWYERTDRGTDIVPFHRPCSAYYADSESKPEQGRKDARKLQCTIYDQINTIEQPLERHEITSFHNCKFGGRPVRKI